ncbi:hypothetical protein CDO73_19005 [Saccharibacillus sp. O23]|uniref:S-layer homology domain-containing protein n=1 Tax=Saccharibacillus sp. O23 TaxID=2009338 RepID=UPI000B4DFDC3|nr:S-layer homology domain-containing protein [Saccharibacillus sp. O23]OWR28360.1 hypothetical protein CDO73_19005 [Saccharibacillus sp. O23]
MKRLSVKKNRKWPALLASAVLATSVWPAPLPVSAATDNSNVVISQVYGGGGNSGAKYIHDFIELYNPTDAPISLEGWKIRYAAADKSLEGSTNTAALNGTIAPNGYYLVEGAAGNGGTDELPLPDASTSLGMGGTNGKLDILNAAGETIDMIGYGTANSYEGNQAAPALNNTTAAIRGAAKTLPAANRGSDTDVNAADFAVGSPDPRNSSYVYAPVTQVESVKPSLAAGALPSGSQVSFSSATPGATIHVSVSAPGETAPFATYAGPITIDGPKTVKVYASADGLEDSETVTYDYTLMEKSSIAQARSTPVDQIAFTEGVITFIDNAEVYIQDGTGGIVLYGYNLPSAKVGDRIVVGGQTAVYQKLLELKPVAGLPAATIEPNVGLPAAQQLSASDLSAAKGGAYEAELVRLDNVKITAKTGSNVTASQNGQTETFAIYSASAKLAVDKTFDSVTGVVKRYGEVYQLIPLGEDALVENTFSVIANPQAGKIVRGGEVKLASPAPNAAIHYTTDGTVPTAASTLYASSAPIILTEDTTIKAILIAGGDTSEVYEFAYTVVDQPRIHDIQGSSHTSAYDGQNVSNIEGVVTQYGYSFGNGAYKGFFLQDNEPDDDPATSEGIFVYSTNTGLKPQIGDLVRVSGKVSEYNEGSANNLTSTQIAMTSVEKVSGQTAPMPEPIVLGATGRPIPSSIIDDDDMTEFDPETDAIDFYESLEGMRVTLPKPTIISPYWKSGGGSSETYNIATRVDNGGDVISPAGGLVLKEYLNYNPQRLIIAYGNPGQEVGTGDTFAADVTGVIGYNNANFKIIPAQGQLPAITPSTYEQETTQIVPAEDKLMIASYNIENFYPGTGEEKIKKLGKSFASNLKQPDIIGVVEMQDGDGPTNNGMTEADASALIAAIADAGGPTYRYTDVAPANNEDGGQPGGNIRVGFLYNPQRVQLADSVNGVKGEAKTAVAYDATSGHLTHNPGRIDPTNAAFDESRKPLAAQFVFKGESVIVIANHFNSKGGDNSPFGKIQPPVLSSEVQRHEIAKVVNGFVKNVLADNPKANIVALGDLNDFQFTPTASILRGGELVNLIDTLPLSEQYTYTYDGNSQVLDHILASKNIASSAKIDVVHLNADFPESRGRVSDHDPVVAQFDLKPAATNPDPGTNPGNPGNPNSPGTVPTPTPGSGSPANPNPGTGTNNGQTGGTSPSAGDTPVKTITAAELGAQIAALPASSDELRIALDAGTGGAEAVLPGAELLRQVAAKPDMTVAFVADHATYSLPLQVLLAANLTAQLGENFELKVSMTNAEKPIVDGAAQAAALSSLKLAAPIVEFRVAAQSGGKSVDLNEFGGTYVKRTIALPEGQNTQDLTGVMYDPASGEFSFVPSVFAKVDGKNQAVLLRNGNSVYTVVESSRTFGDIAGHWAQAPIEELASRLIVDGTGTDAFAPARNVTRAEFAALIVRSLGLTPNASAAAFFKDTDGGAWYAEAVGTAVGAGFMSGYPDGTFRPNAPITRQEMAVVLSQAAEFAGFALQADASAASRLGDLNEAPAWSREALAGLISFGIMQGRADGRIAPGAEATRAETAALIEKLLKKMQFID